MISITRRNFAAASLSMFALAACTGQRPTQGASAQSGGTAAPARLTTRAEPLAPVAERYGITPINYAARPDGPHNLRSIGMSGIPAQFHRQVVPYSGRYAPGTIIVDNAARNLFLVLPQGHALRYGVAVGRDGFSWRGRGSIYRKSHWPTWTPTARMMRRDPALRKYAGGFPGGPDNPLGARALYLLTGGRDIGYRIHGTPEWWLIGQEVSSGCIRMIDHDVIDLYERVGVGTRVIVL